MASPSLISSLMPMANGMAFAINWVDLCSGIARVEQDQKRWVVGGGQRLGEGRCRHERVRGMPGVNVLLEGDQLLVAVT
jgi:hypothetical protein